MQKQSTQTDSPEFMLLPTDTRLTEFGVRNEKLKGNNIPLSKYTVLKTYWEEVYYPYPHSTKRIELKKGSGKITYVRYVDTTNAILAALNNTKP